MCAICHAFCIFASPDSCFFCSTRQLILRLILNKVRSEGGFVNFGDDLAKMMKKAG